MACLDILVFYLKSSLAVLKSCKLFPLSTGQELGFTCASAVCLSPSGCPQCPWHSSPSNTTRPSICASLLLWAQNHFPSLLTSPFPFCAWHDIKEPQSHQRGLSIYLGFLGWIPQIWPKNFKQHWAEYSLNLSYHDSSRSRISLQNSVLELLINWGHQKNPNN